MFKIASSTSQSVGFFACSGGTASLHSVLSSGSVSAESLATTSIDANGNYEFRDISIHQQKLQGTGISAIVRVTGCGMVYARPLTGTRNQDVSASSTLIALTTELSVPGKRSLRELTPSEVQDLLNRLQALPQTTIYDCLLGLLSDSALATSYRNLLAVDAIELRNVPPTVSMTPPSSVLAEGVTTHFAPVVTHWNPDYLAALSWELDGVQVSQADRFDYLTGQNSQGSHQLKLKVGSRNGSGQIDLLKPVSEQTFVFSVSNNFPALTPSLRIALPVVSSGLPISTRSLTLEITTGSALENCASFSNLALTEENEVPSSFDLTCTVAGAQTWAYSLRSPGDGTKTLKLWTKDAAGNISASPTVLQFTLDTAAPSVTLMPLASVSGSTSVRLEFSASDNGGTVSLFECQLDSGSIGPCSSPAVYSGLAQGSHLANVWATDTAGNKSVVATGNWVVDLTPPTVSWTATPALLTQNGMTSFQFSIVDTGGGNVQQTECRLDGGSWSICISPWSSVVAEGFHLFEVRATDSVGNISGSQSYSWNVDQTGPSSLITSSPASTTNSTSATLSFSGVDTGGATLASFECSLDGSAFAACSSPRTYSGLATGLHSFQVRATDSVGNTGVAVSTSWSIDLTTPMASISSQPPSLSGSTTAQFAFSANPPPAGSIVGYQCRLDGGSWGACSSPVNYSGLSEGAHSFEVRAIDNNSSVSSSTSASWTIDLTPPILSVVSAPPGYNNSTSATLSFNASDVGGATVAGFHCRKDGGAWSVCSSPLNYSSITEGSHSVQITAEDSVGNVSAPTSLSWVTDLTAPTVGLTATPSAVTNSSVAVFQWTGTDTGGSSVARFECALDGAAFSNCTSPTTLNTLAAGSHSFAVRAVDSAGNVGTSQSAGWMIDQTPPTVTIMASPSAVSSSTSASFSLVGIDTGGASFSSFQCSLDGGSFSTCSSPATYSSLSQGSHQFSVRGLDTAGNQSTPINVTWVVDSISPVLSFSTPASNGSVVLTSSLSSVSVSGSCETGLTVQISGAATGSVACSAGTWSTSLSLVSSAEGTLSLTASQTDAAGNTGSAVRTLVKDVTAPVLSLTSPSGVLTPGSSWNLNFTATEANITSSQSFTVASSSDNGSTWTTAGTVSAVAGPLTARAFSFSWTVPSVDSAQMRLRVTGVDQAGNSASVTSSPFTVDATKPVLSSLVLAGGATSIGQPTITVDMTATDNLSGITQYQINETGTVSGSAWQSFSTRVNYNLSSVNGAKTVYAWVRDAAGNVSDPMTKNITLSSSIPAVSILSPTASSSYSAGQSVPVSWTCTDTGGLSSNPISIFYTVDDGNTFTAITTGISNSGSYSWTLPNGVGAFRLLVGCQSVSGVVGNAYSPMINTGGWKIYAGDPWYGRQNVAAPIAKVVGANTNLSLVADNDNNIYYVLDNQIMKINGLSGLVSVLAGDGSGTCRTGTTSAASSGGFGTPIILGLDIDRTGLLLSDHNCGKVFRVALTDGTVTAWATLPSGAVLSQGTGVEGSFFLTKNRILIFYSNTQYFYRLDLSTSGQTAQVIMGNGTTPSGATSNRYSVGTVVLGKQIFAYGNGLSIFATPDASKIWWNPYNFGNYTRHDWNGTAYEVAIADGGKNWGAVHNCISTDFDSYVYCTSRGGSPGGSQVFMIDTTLESTSPSAGLVPMTDNYQAGNLVVGSAKDRLVSLYSVNSIDMVIPSWSGTWKYYHIAGQLMTVMGNGTSLADMAFDRVMDIKYNQATSTLWLGTTIAYARRVLYSAGNVAISTVYGATNVGRTSLQFNVNLAGNKLVSIFSCSRSYIGVNPFNSASPASFGTAVYQLGGVCDATSYTYTYPAPTGSGISGTLIVGAHMDFSTNVVVASNGRTYFATKNSSVATQDVFIYSSNGSTLTRVAGVTGAGGYLGTDSGGLAVNAKLSRVLQLQEVASGSHQGDLLIWDGDRLRLITIATDSLNPRIYDLYSFTMAAGYVSGAGFYDAYYDSSSEVSGVIGTGKMYYADTANQVHKFVPSADLTSATDTIYSFTGTTLSGGVRLTLHPTDGLLILQKNKNRILRVDP